MNTKDIEKYEEEFHDNEYSNFDCCGNNLKLTSSDLSNWLRTTLTKVAEESRQLGRNEILKEWNRDQRKLLDGFNHPKDCKLCEQPILCKQCELEGNAGVCDRKHCKNYKND